mmetsp:Transcript_14108/g.30385  ORF Transcript_14108/g.30385 Transcript_14108/m.30385 type:complete len:125 (+) Transcript_14108:147-521(+)
MARSGSLLWRPQHAQAVDFDFETELNTHSNRSPLSVEDVMLLQELEVRIIEQRGPTDVSEEETSSGLLTSSSSSVGLSPRSSSSAAMEACSSEGNAKAQDEISRKVSFSQRVSVALYQTFSPSP